ncbi:MAG: glycogen synthase GlgA [bacterium]
MRIGYVSSEITPYASTGGLADVAGALPNVVARKGHEVWRAMPMYRCVLEGSFKLVDLGLKLNIPVGFHSRAAEVWSTENKNPATYFIRRDEFFDRSQLYSLPNRDYDDNFERFVFFQKAVVAMIDALSLKPQIVHGNDWQAGLVPLFLEHGIQGIGRGRKEKTIFTIHNLAYQGLFSGNEFSVTNLPFSSFQLETMEFYGNINCMKNGITSSDVVTTVSKTYASDIQTEKSGCGLHGVLTKVRDKVIGIVNGIDDRVWNPAADPYLTAPYSAVNPSGKKACRKDLLARMNLTVKPGAPVIGMISRLVDQKGFDILAAAMPELMKRDLAIVLLGTGEEKHHERCNAWARTWPGKFACKLAFDTELSHKIEAGADLFLMPSRFEPCGLNQMYSLRYGTVPVVHATGGLEDTVEDMEASGAAGTGFKFRSYTAQSLVDAVDRALALYRCPQVWQQVVVRAMQQDFSWNHAAEEYLQLYASLVSSV